ncbi:uncharacterized protein LOC112349879 [Selaginella moellendorffii]|uniref:uncharacterized protein LOC112349879 n=1 Tax=Selaginella moellendorffii TaxID=88036 RepID=UPI000D1CE2C2|nr:uncharacterized protein LOC112349879 [Selaginella moellendorffii]|eukprot:XP_024540827.1 uncharacterized protein LOC112349879 [Selaginella moellendorffii]
MGLFSRLRHRHHHHEEEEEYSAGKDHVSNEQELIVEQQEQQQQHQERKPENEMLLPLEEPIEPPENILPIKCPHPEPCIVHDGRIWKERIAAKRSSSVGANTNGRTHHSRAGSMRLELLPRNHVGVQAAHTPASPTVITSYSAPEKALITMLD